MERRLQALEGHGLKETAEQALQLATTNERRIEALERRGPAAPVESGAATPVRRKTQAERIEENATLSIREQALEIGIHTTHEVLLHHLNLFGKFDEKGAADRKTQALSDAQRVAGAWKMDQDKAREIYLSSMDRYATEVGPLVGNGLKSADLETVRARYRGITDDRDRKLGDLLDGAVRTQFLKESKARLEVEDDLLEGYQKER